MDNKRMSRASKIAAKMWVSHHIKGLLNDRGISVKQLAQITPLNVCEIEDMIHGKFMPPIDVFLQVLYACGTNFQIIHSEYYSMESIKKLEAFSKVIESNTKPSSIIIKFD